MKKHLILLILTLVVFIYAYFFVYKDTKNLQPKTKPFVSLEGLSEVFISGDFGEVRLQLREGFWWVIHPQTYPANQELVEQALSSMVSSHPREQFKLQEDCFGLSPGRAFVELVHNSGERLRFVIGSVSGPMNSLYVMNQDDKSVFVVHNVWGQFLYHKLKDYYHQGLPITGAQVKAIELYSETKKIWTLHSKSQRELLLSYGKKQKTFLKADFLWFFSRLRDFEMNSFSFNRQAKFKESRKMLVKTEKGNITFVFSTRSPKIFIPSLNVFAEYKAFSLKSLDDELQKVMKSGKK